MVSQTLVCKDKPTHAPRTTPHNPMSTMITDEYVAPGAFADTSFKFVHLPNAVHICEDAFRGSAVEYIKIPRVVEIEENAFRGSRLRVVHGAAVERVEQGAFEDCRFLTRVELPNATHVGDVAFRGCHALETVVLDRAERIGHAAFDHCVSLAHLHAPCVTEVGFAAFTRTRISNTFPRCTRFMFDTFAGCSVDTFEHPDVTQLDDGVFVDCTALKHVRLDNARVLGVPTPGRDEDIRNGRYCGIFQDCTALESVKVPKVEIIHDCAFGGCHALETVVLPVTLHTLDKRAFAGTHTDIVSPICVRLEDFHGTLHVASPAHYQAAEILKHSEWVLDVLLTFDKAINFKAPRRVFRQTKVRKRQCDTRRDTRRDTRAKDAIMIVREQYELLWDEFKPFAQLFRHTPRMAQLMLGDVYPKMKHYTRL